MKAKYVVGVDIGGSHVTAAVMDMEENVLLRHTLVRRSLDAQADSETIFDCWQAAVSNSMHLLGEPVTLIGIAMPGPVDYEQGICYIKGQQKYDALFGLNLKAAISERLELETGNVFMANDAACFMQGEADGGAGTGLKRLLGFTLGTGFGSARFHGSFAADADLWHRPFRNAIAEEFFSTRWFVNECAARFGKQFPDVHAIVKALDDEPALKSLFLSFGRNMGIFLSELIMEEKPDAIILGGNISNAYAHFESALVETLRSSKLQVPVLISQLGEEAALVGAASFASRAKETDLRGINQLSDDTGY